MEKLMTTDPAAVSSLDLTFLAVYFVVMAALTGLACLAWRGAVAARREADRCANREYDRLAECIDAVRRAEVYATQAELASKSRVPRKPKPRRRKP